MRVVNSIMNFSRLDYVLVEEGLGSDRKIFVHFISSTSKTEIIEYSLGQIQDMV